MTFIAAKTPTYFAPAQLNTLDADGKLLENKFDLKFKRKTKSELEALDQRIASMRKAKDGAKVDRMVMEEVCDGWRSMQSADGSDLPFSMKAVDNLEEDFPGFLKASVEAFYRSTQPTESAHLAAKN